MLKGKDLISIHDLSASEVEEILTLAGELKEKQKQGVKHHLLAGKSLGMIFEKASTRTRVSFEVGMYQLGGQALFLSGRDLQIGRGEPVRDTARVLSRYLDGIMIRTFGHDTLLEFAEWADVPVINALTDLLHPCQALTDLLTIREHLQTDFKNLKLAFIGDGNNMANSLLYACAKTGMSFAIAAPEGYELNPEIVRQAQEDAAASGAEIVQTHDINEAAAGANVLCTDVWTSMGEETERAVREKAFAGYQINSELLGRADRQAIVMHCLPAHRGEEITDEVVEKYAQVIFDEAENRLHTQKAIMALLMGD